MQVSVNLTANVSVKAASSMSVEFDWRLRKNKVMGMDSLD